MDVIINIFAIFGICTLIVGIILTITILPGEIKDRRENLMRTKIERLRSENVDLDVENQSLRSRISQDTEDYIDLSRRYDDLRDQYKKLTDERDGDGE